MPSFLDRLRKAFGRDPADDASVLELLELLKVPYPEKHESGRMMALAMTIGRSAEHDAVTAARLLARFLRGLDAPHPQTAGLVAVLCGAFIENGADVDMLSRPLLERVRRAIQDAMRLVDASRSVAEVEEGDGLQIGERWIAEDWIHQHVDADPVAVQSFVALDFFFQATIALLCRSPAWLQSSEADAIFDGMQKLGTAGKAARLLDRLLRVPVRETWLVLDPAREVGVEVEVSGVADAFQVYALMHRALHNAGQWTNSPSLDVTRVADGTGPEASGATYSPPFGLFRWSAVDDSRTVPDTGTHVMDWYSNSAIPAELARHGGRRIAVLGKCSMQMVYATRRCFPGLPASIKPTRQLSATEFSAAWRALASAPRMEHPIPFVGWR